MVSGKDKTSFLLTIMQYQNILILFIIMQFKRENLLPVILRQAQYDRQWESL